MSDEIVLSDANFEQEVLKSALPVLVDFWAEWCGPCRTLSPIIEELAKEYSGKVKVGKVNVDQCPGTAGQYGIRGIPTILFFKGGSVAEQTVGLQSKAALTALIEKNL